MEALRNPNVMQTGPHNIVSVMKSVHTVDDEYCNICNDYIGSYVLFDRKTNE